jgi:hypothetical protein
MYLPVIAVPPTSLSQGMRGHVLSQGMRGHVLSQGVRGHVFTCYCYRFCLFLRFCYWNLGTLPTVDFFLIFLILYFCMILSLLMGDLLKYNKLPY